MKFQHDPEGLRLPIKVDSSSNGEFEPIPISPMNEVANEEAMFRADANARYLGKSRRSFLVSACGAATTLMAFNTVNAAAGKTGGFFDVPQDAAYDEGLARDVIDGKEFIFDVHGHYVNPRGKWLDSLPEGAKPFGNFPAVTACAPERAYEGLDYLECLSGKQFIKDVFVESDTDMMVLSFVPSTRDSEPLTIEEADATRSIIDAMDGSKRLMIHGRVNPNQDGDLDSMDELAEKWGISAWKTYTQWGPQGKGFFLHDEDTGLLFIEKARRLGVKNIAVHKGIPFGPQSYEHSRADDIGVVAKMYPDMNFLVYHSGFVPGKAEEAFAVGAGKDGIDALVQSLLDNGIKPNSNVYADLGSTWRFVMRDPDSAAHTLGKLLKYVGEDNVLWGTDCIWYGSPQDQIQAFRAFQISEEFQDKYGYSELTPRIKRKVFGLNAATPYRISPDELKTYMAQDQYAFARAEYQDAPDPHFLSFGPKTRRSFLSMLRANGGNPA